jgi:hypothetical protein
MGGGIFIHLVHTSCGSSPLADAILMKAPALRFWSVSQWRIARVFFDQEVCQDLQKREQISEMDPPPIGGRNELT